MGLGDRCTKSIAHEELCEFVQCIQNGVPRFDLHREEEKTEVEGELGELIEDEEQDQGLEEVGEGAADHVDRHVEGRGLMHPTDCLVFACLRLPLGFAFLVAGDAAKVCEVATSASFVA